MLLWQLLEIKYVVIIFYMYFISVNVYFISSNKKVLIVLALVVVN